MKPTLLDKSRPGSGGSWVMDEEFPIVDMAQVLTGVPLRESPLGLPEVSEIEVVRHFTDLSEDSHGVDSGMYPLGSCTMKYNPKCNDAYAGLDGFRFIHPHQPDTTMQGVLELLYDLQIHIAEITGVDAVSLQPAAGAHGELAGLLVIRKHFLTIGEPRSVVLVADSAHGTNPSSAAMAGFKTEIIPTRRDGLMDLDALSARLGPDVAALMLTNPSTLGLFEENIERIAEVVHANGSLLYYDGANMNALMGIARPGDMGFDVVHINTHKTLSTPHGGGGPGAGPVGVKNFLARFLPAPTVKRRADGHFFLDYGTDESIGRVKGHFGHIGVLIRAESYIRAMGPNGLRQATENAVLNANYLQSQLHDIMPSVFNKLCMHECLLSGKQLPTLPYHFAKRLIDHGVHPPTLVGAGCVYFPEDLNNSMLIEPTETETRENLDRMIRIFRDICDEARANSSFVEMAPHSGSTRKIPERAREIEPDAAS